jgi:hypothetical protein
MMAAPWCAAASLDFAVSVNFSSLYNRFGVDPQGNILIAANPDREAGRFRAEAAVCDLPGQRGDQCVYGGGGHRGGFQWGQTDKPL